MIIYSSGDIFESNTTALVNAVNCQGVMGKGIAYQFKEKFPKNFINYKTACDENRFKIGNILITSEKGKLIVNFPTKDEWRKKSQYEYIEKGLLTLKEEIIKREINSIALPPLGCGNGGLDWNRVEELIINIFSDLENVDILLYAPITKNIGSKDKTLLNIEHLIVLYAMSHLKDKKRYSLNTLFYLCQKLSGYNSFNFSVVYGRAYSNALDVITNDLRNLKEKQGVNFDSFIDNYINTHISKKMENEFKKAVPKLKTYIELLNELDGKDEFSELINIVEIISNKDIFTSILLENNDVKKMIIEKMINIGFIQKNILGQYEFNYNLK